MRLFVKLFLLAFGFVVVASGIATPPLSTEWLIADCVAAAAIMTLIVRRFGPALPAARSEEFEFEIVTDEEYEEIAQ